MASSVADTPTPAVGHHGEGENYINAKKGIMSWLITVDHKRIGMMYLGALLFFFLIGGMAALLVRTELLTAGKDVISDQNN